MSHVATIKTQYKDLAALKSAVVEMGGRFHEGRTTHKSWQHGLKCDHVIAVPNVEYEIGVTRNNDGTYALNWDTFGSGQGLVKKFGENCSKLTQMYAVHAVKNQAFKNGMTMQRNVLANGSIKLVLTGASL